MKDVMVARSKQLYLCALNLLHILNGKLVLNDYFLLWLAVTVNPFPNHLVSSDNVICISEHLTGLNLFTHSYLQHNSTFINVKFIYKLLNVEFRCFVKCVCGKRDQVKALIHNITPSSQSLFSTFFVGCKTPLLFWWQLFTFYQHIFVTSKDE